MRLLSLACFLLISSKLTAQCNSAFSFTVNGGQVTFSPQNTQPGFTHIWNFGDGYYGSSVSPVHNYAQPGTYAIHHILRDSLQTCMDSTVMVVVLNFTPTCQAGFSIARDSTVLTLYRFTSTSSYSGPDPISHHWSIDNVVQPNNSGSLAYNFSPGVHTVCLTINAGACFNTICQTVNVQAGNNCNLQVSFTNTFSSNFPRMVTFTASPQRPGLIYRWNFGDGSGTFTLPVAYHLYNNYGPYTVKLVISDPSLGCTDSTVRNIQVHGTRCDSTDCSFTYTLNNNNNPGEVAFNGSCNKPGGVQRWEIWKPADSLHVIINANNPTYTFQDTGYYYVCLYVTFPDTCQITTCQTLLINEVHHRNTQLPVYPNPVQSDLKFFLDVEATSRINIRIIDRNGHSVIQSEKIVFTGNNIITLPVSNLSPGLYFIEIINGGNKKRSTFIKQ